MPPMIELTIWRENRQVWSGMSGLPLELGRQRRDEPESSLISVQDLGNHFRLAIAPITDLTVPREALRLTLSGQGSLKLINIHTRLSFHVGMQSTPLPPGESIQSPDEVIVSLPGSMAIKATLLPEDVVDPEGNEGDSSFRVLPEDLTATMQISRPTSFTEWFASQNDPSQGRAAVDLVRQALSVVLKSAGSNEFFDAAVRSAAEMVALDRAFILLKDEKSWRVRSKFVVAEAAAETSIDSSTHEQMPSGSTGLLRRMLVTGQTVLYDPNAYTHTAGPSMMVLDRAVATPIRDQENKIIGALYGDRRMSFTHDDAPIGDLEATLLEVMAGAVSGGLARQKQEAIRAALGQFFSPSVTQRLEHNEDLLTGRDAEVTVLFCDIRGFSRICERVGPQRTFQWINDVLTQLSQCVMRTDGVLVDYVGDELMAMWGAPGDQPDHALRACMAACDILAQIEPLREKWMEITPDYFGVGIGINTGKARVGNTGSNVKFKYGPLGNVVNMASRVQGITKKFGAAALITEATARSLPAARLREFPLRCLATVCPFGVAEAVTLYELKPQADHQWLETTQKYQVALELYQQKNLESAAQILDALQLSTPSDQSVDMLRQQVHTAMKSPYPFDPVLRFDSK